MLKTETRYAVDPISVRQFGTDELRDNFLANGLFVEGEIKLVCTHYERLILGSAVPSDGEKLILDAVSETGTASFLDRREMGVLNIGDTGTVAVNGESYELANGEVLYIGLGNGPIEFSGPGRFYLLSAPAHRSCPVKLIRHDDAKRVEMGTNEQSNKRVIHQFIHPEVVDSCQLVMGCTKFDAGSIWNTMPAHQHDRRMEAYMYYGLESDNRVFHFMGEPEHTRHIVIANEEAVVSPSWSIHCGAGTGSYTFCWAMAGENVDFTDMDMVGMDRLR